MGEVRVWSASPACSAHRWRAGSGQSGSGSGVNRAPARAGRLERDVADGVTGQPAAGSGAVLRQLRERASLRIAWQSRHGG